jgi:hypothetical protein
LRIFSRISLNVWTSDPVTTIGNEIRRAGIHSPS